MESIPAIIEFLGRDPFGNAASLSDRLAAARRTRGWTIKQAAEQLGVGGGVSGGTDHGEGQGQGSSDLGEVTECNIFTGQCSFL